MRRTKRFHHVLALAAAVFHYGCGPGPEATVDIGDVMGHAMGESMDIPASAGSQSPNLATGPGGELVLSWLERDERGHKLQYSRLQGATWSPALSVARGDNWFVNWADFPSVVPVSDSLWAAHWLVRQPAGGYAYDIFLSLSSDGGSTWSQPFLAHNDGTPTEHGFVTLYPQAGEIGLVWLDGRNMAGEATSGTPPPGMTLRSARVSSDFTISDESVVDDFICDCCQTDVAVTGEGHVAVYRDRTRDERRDISAARYAGGEWQRGSSVAEDGWIIGGCPVNGPVVGADGDQLAVAWFTAAGGASRVRLARSPDGGRTFSAPVDVADGESFGRVGLAMLGGGDVAVSWLCKESDDRAMVCLRVIAAGDAPGPVHVLSRDHEVSPLTVPQLARSGKDLVAAWTVREADGTSIAGRRLPIESLR